MTLFNRYNILDINKHISEAYDEFASGLFTFAKYMLYNPLDAEDLLQETFIIYYNQLKNDVEIFEIKSFLYSTIRNLCLRKNRDNKIYVEIDDSIDEIYKTEISFNSELYELILKSLPKLDAKYREAYILREIQGIEYHEIAEILNITQSGVRTRVARAIINLKKILNPIIIELEKFN